MSTTGPGWFLIEGGWAAVVVAERWAAINVAIIAVHIALLLYGYWLIRWRRDIRAHRRAMVAAGLVFLTFLTSFVVRIAALGPSPLAEWDFVVQPRHLQAVHALIAVVTVGVVAATYWLAYTRRFARHRRLAPWALALWIFTGAFGIFGFFAYP